MKGVLILITVFLLSAATNFLLPQSITYDPGNGLHIKSKDKKLDFMFSGYINTIFAYHNVYRNDTVQNSFSVHRARIDLGLDYTAKYKAFIEFDAAGQRTAMVLAHVQVRLFDNNYLMAGKFIDPFSAENNRSTSRLTTIERYSGLNSIFLLPGLDTQYGIMFFGGNTKADLKYYLSITNGNGEAGQNISENNNSKNITGRLEYRSGNSLSLGGSLSFAKEQQQILSLPDHTFESFSGAKILGRRIGYLANFAYDKNPFLFRGEGFIYSFKNALTQQNQVKNFTGGYLEAGYFLTGSSENGVQLVGRFETARYGHTLTGFAGPTVLNSYLLGINWLMDNIFSFQVNLVYEKANSNSVIAVSRLTGKDNEMLLLTTLQLRF